MDSYKSHKVHCKKKKVGNEQITYLGLVHFLLSWINADNSEDVLGYKREGAMEDLACLAAPEPSCPKNYTHPTDRKNVSTSDLRMLKHPLYNMTLILSCSSSWT